LFFGLQRLIHKIVLLNDISSLLACNDPLLDYNGSLFEVFWSLLAVMGIMIDCNRIVAG
jgi:hypothetical protein